MDVQHMDDEELDDIQYDADTPTAVNSMPSNNLVALSDDSSSILSEVDDGASDNDETGLGSVERNSSHDVDSEAETERLDISPQKARDQPIAAGRDQTINNGNKSPSTIVLTKTRVSDKLTENKITDDADDDDDDDAVMLERRYSRSPENRFSNGRILSPPDIAGHKRKRSGSIVDNASTLGEIEPSTKRTASLRREDVYAEHEKIAVTSDAGVADDEGSDALSDVTSASDLTAVPGDILVYTNGTIVNRSSPVKDATSPSTEDDAMSDHEIIDIPQEEEVPNLSIIKPEDELEVDEVADLEADEEEAETAAKSEDEMAKKKSAMEALLPIEKLFAIFRDRLFDQRLADLSSELELLNDPNSTHPEYLAMKQCIDERREQKIQLENMLLFYRQKNMESLICASRAQLHSQYFQTVRGIRERHMEVLNRMCCATMKERRRMQTREPEFGYKFNPKRSQQIAQQMSYNKEVSLLSGIARYVGFPSAPEMQGARRSEMDDDFRAMQVKFPGIPKPNFATISATTKASDAAAEEHFYEKNPWAANPQLHTAQSMLIDRASPRIAVATASPITLMRNVSANNNTNAATWMTPEIHTNSTTVTPIDQNIKHSAHPHRPGGTPSNGNSSSPFEIHHPRGIATGASVDSRSGPTQAPSANPTSTTAADVTGAPSSATTTLAATTTIAPPTTSSSTTTTAATTAATTRFERPYKPKNIPPPSSSIYTPSPRTPMPTFMRTAQSALLSGGGIGSGSGNNNNNGEVNAATSVKNNNTLNNKDDVVVQPPRFERITGFTAVNGGHGGNVASSAAAGSGSAAAASTSLLGGAAGGSGSGVVAGAGARSGASSATGTGTGAKVASGPNGAATVGGGGPPPGGSTLGGATPGAGGPTPTGGSVNVAQRGLGIGLFPGFGGGR